VYPEVSWAGLTCHTHQHYHRQWLPNTEWSDFMEWAWARDRWLWRERLRAHSIGISGGQLATNYRPAPNGGSWVTRQPPKSAGIESPGA